MAEKEDRARHCGEDRMSHDSKGTMLLVFHEKSALWNCIEMHFSTGYLQSSDSGEFRWWPPPLFYSPAFLWMGISLGVKVRNEEPHQKHLCWSFFSCWWCPHQKSPSPAALVNVSLIHLMDSIQTWSLNQSLQRVSERKSVPSQLHQP
jgi:hypothetical protein